MGQLMKLLISFIALLFHLNAQDLIIEPDDGTQPILRAIDSAKSSVDIAIYRLDHTYVLNSLKQAHSRGVKVRIILNPPTNSSNIESEIDLTEAWKKLKQNEVTATDLRNTGIEVHYASLDNLVLFHTKLMIIDSQAAYVMTFNMNQSGFECGRNFGYITRDPLQITNLSGYFESQIDSRPFWDYNQHICFNPDYQRIFITLYLLQTVKSLDIYQATLTDPWMALYLYFMAELGKEIRILITPDLFGTDESSEFRKLLTTVGVKFRYMTSPYVHAKLLIRDGNSMLITSCNFWADGLDRSGELSINTKDTDSVKKALNTFNLDWDSAQIEWAKNNKSSLE